VELSRLENVVVLAKPRTNEKKPHPAKTDEKDKPTK
jgi:hypothetical protein